MQPPKTNFRFLFYTPKYVEYKKVFFYVIMEVNI